MRILGISREAALAMLRKRVMDRLDVDTYDLHTLLALIDGEHEGRRVKRLASAEARCDAIREWADDCDFDLDTLKGKE